ncbi:MAG: response regulator [Myxococcaceae bacterium]|nr:MAG: response regulator [Myxococcaceae bacterium]
MAKPPEHVPLSPFHGRRAEAPVKVEELLAGGGQTGALMRTMDWSQTLLGPVHTWPQSFRTALGITISSRFPSTLYWGPDFLMLYNDDLLPMVGANKHPWALGRPAFEVLPEIRQIIEPLLRQVMDTGEATWSEDLMLPLQRGEAPEEGYFTFSYSPVRDESGGVGGVLCCVLETSDKVIEGRRLRLLNALADATQAKTPTEACSLAAAHLAQSPSDVPFALIYLIDEAAGVARLAGATNIAGGHALAPTTITLGDEAVWPLDVTAPHGSPRVVPLVAGPGGARGAVVLPIERAGGGRPVGFIIAGLSALLRSSESYQRFHNLLAASIGQAVSNAAAYESERQRAEALAQIDRAKTAFFSNVSHEFRTPLTLMLGPLEDALADTQRHLLPEQYERLSLVHRNSQRLLKLVNSLLEFSRLEAGRMRASFEPTDLASLTSGLASAFDSVVARSQMRLVVDCPPLPEPVFVDRDMWEKIVLNLVSNAFKFTFEGEISVRLRWLGSRVELAVQDSGTGIPAEELPRIFERFHRVQGAQGRSYEGSGIGLALVQELVKLHGGSVAVESAPGKGSTFTISLPTGNTHLPGEQARDVQQLVATTTGAQAFVHEAAQWLSSASSKTLEATNFAASATREPSPDRAIQGHVLLADDNADMRDYMSRLLRSRFTVEAVADGWQALEAARAQPPDVVLSDIMMPGLDGFGLLRELRADARTAHVPVVMLSARAGEEAKVEGLNAGADDYLVKPFGANELVARVEGTVRAAQGKAERERFHREMEAIRLRLQNLIQNAPAFIATLQGPEHVFEMINPPYQRLVGTARKLEGLSVKEALPEIMTQGFSELLDGVYRTGEPFIGREVLAQLDRQGNGHLEDAFLNFVYQPRRNPQGQVDGIDVFGFEVTDQVQARKMAETLAGELRQRADFEQQLIGIVSHDLRNPVSAILFGTDALLRAGGLSERQTKGAERIQSAAERANVMIRDLLDFTQARLAGGIRIERRAANLHQLIQVVVDEVRATHAGRDIKVRHEGDGLGQWDPDRIEQVVQNLLTNSLKYSPEGSPVELETHAEEGSVSISVHNQGAPIPPEKLRMIFQPLQRATDEVDRTGRSIGLGLYIVELVVDAHGGTVAVESTAEGGTTFTVRLPRKAVQPS